MNTTTQLPFAEAAKHVSNSNRRSISALERVVEGLSEVLSDNAGTANRAETVDYVRELIAVADKGIEELLDAQGEIQERFFQAQAQ